MSLKSSFRLNELLYFRSAFKSILSELEYGRLTFTETLENCVDINTNVFFSSMYNAVKNNNSVKVAWKYAFEENAKKSHLTSEDIKRLSSVGDGFNSGDIELMKSNVNMAVDYISSQEKALMPIIQRDKKLYRSVSLTIGLFAVVLFI